MKRLSKDKFLSHLRERILVFDGAMGSTLQTQNLTHDDFGGFDGCNEALNIHCPDAVRTVHSSFLAAGCRGIETNTFGATKITLQEYGLQNRVSEINRAAVRIAREAIEANPGDEPKFIAGSIGPTSKLPSLGKASFDEMSTAYTEQIDALIQAGIDIILIETCQDPLQIKAALKATSEVFRKEGIQLPVIVSVTIEAAGTMLVGTDIGAIQTILEPYEIIDAIGINCATGPLEMVRHVRHLSRNSRKHISVMPNAGLPEIVQGKPIYRLSPDELAQFHLRFVEQDGVSIVGGCCGTSPAHIEAVVKAVGQATPQKRSPAMQPSAASLFYSVPFCQNPPPCMVGERTNATGSKIFRELLLKEDWENIVYLGKEQAKGGAHFLDLSVAYAGRNERQDLETLVPLFATQVKLPLMIDSTDPTALETALKLHGGRCIINSVNLEDGGKRLAEIASLARDFGAALVCLTIDEDGMAKTSEKKLEIAQRLYNLLTKEYALSPSDLIFDALTFTVGSGDPDLRCSAMETLEGLRLIGQAFPESLSILGVSNISYGLNHEAREVLNSVFLDEAVKRGLRLAIVNPAGIIPLFKIPAHQRDLARDLVFNLKGDGSDLSAFIKAFESKTAKIAKKPVASRGTKDYTPAKAMTEKILDGDKTGLPEIIDRLREKLAAEVIINKVFIKAMKKVGDLFGKGEMQLPFVLQSAEVVRAAVSYLEPHLEKKTGTAVQKIVLATVSGDVHDIGKNLVSIVLSNNGFQVIDLGIKVDIDKMVRAAKEHHATVIGMSGLLVKSVQIMKENLEELNRREFTPDIILGGAALTKDFVDRELKPLYRGRVFRAGDAFEGLAIMRKLHEKKLRS